MAIIQGDHSSASSDVGSTSKGAYVEIAGDRLEDYLTNPILVPYSLGYKRVPVTLHSFGAPAVTETQQTFSLYRNFVLRPTGQSQTSFTPRFGYRFVAIGMTAHIRNGTAAVHGTIVRVRANQQNIPGTTSITEASLVMSLGVGVESAVINVCNANKSVWSPGFPGLFHLVTGNSIIITMEGVAAADTEFTLFGFEY